MGSVGRRSPTTEDAFSGPRAAGIAGISYRRLDYWARKGIVEPSIRVSTGSGTFRLYSPSDILALKVTKRLRQEGISLATIQRAVAALDASEAPTAVLRKYTFWVSRGRLLAASDRSSPIIDVTKGAQLALAIGFGLSLAAPRKPLARAERRTKRAGSTQSRLVASLLDEALYLSERRG